jgi:uncharacterized protein (TIGR02246 family)
MWQAQHPMHAAFEKAFNCADLEALVALYEPAALLNVDPGPAKGLDAIRESYKFLLAMQPKIRVETLGVCDTGDGLALLHGKWEKTGTGPDGPIQIEGKNTEVVRRQADGSWRFVIDNPFAP